MKGCRYSPTEGSPDWARQMQTGSSFPMYLPAVRLSLSVETTQAGPMPDLELILLMAYLEV